jgi:hypothetical protein
MYFKGAFKYLLPTPDSQIEKMKLYASYADKLLGVKLTPATVWNSSPWTWALDWFSNTGDIMTNISELGQDGLALVYGYMMSYAKTKEVITTAAVPGFTSASRTRERVFKKRLPANPYGFGITGLATSLEQKATVIALGLTRGRGGKG